MTWRGENEQRMRVNYTAGHQNYIQMIAYLRRPKADILRLNVAQTPAQIRRIAPHQQTGGFDRSSFAGYRDGSRA